jgi:transcriptional regulator with XRE-family HTH domain
MKAKLGFTWVSLGDTIGDTKGENMMAKSITTFADWVRQRRRTLDLTQAELASRIGCAVVTLRKIEQATRRPSHQLAGLLAQHLAIPAIQQEQFLRMARGEYVEKTAPDPSALHPPVLSAGSGRSKQFCSLRGPRAGTGRPGDAPEIGP